MIEALIIISFHAQNIIALAGGAQRSRGRFNRVSRADVKI